MRTGVVIVHGIADLARAWGKVVAALPRPSLAVDLPGRGSRPADLTRCTLAGAVTSVQRDIEAHDLAEFVVLAHSAGTLLVPGIVEVFGTRVRQVVVAAGLVPPNGARGVDLVPADRKESLDERRDAIRRRWAGHTFRPHADLEVDDLEVLADPLIASAVDSAWLLYEPVDWSAVPASLPRTYVRCVADELQTRAFQDAVVANLAPQEIIELASGHHPGRDAPDALAAIVDAVASRYDGG